MLSSKPLGNVEELSAKLEMMKIGEGEIRQDKRYELVLIPSYMPRIFARGEVYA